MNRFFVIYLISVNFFCASAGQGTEEVLITGKKGACFSRKSGQWSSKISKLNPYWYYSWERESIKKGPRNIEFVPMFWGKWFKDEDIDYLIKLKNKNQIKFILGFNEPDSRSQSNMSVDEVIALWPKLETIGLPLGSPATVNPENQWMIDFMNKVDQLGLRVDFICVHHYGGRSVQGLLKKLDRLYKKYNRPIWITEFALADWDAKTVEESMHTEEDVLEFMRNVLPALERLDYVARYAWFSAKTTNRALGRAPLFDENNRLTTLGRHYASFQATEEKPND